MDLYFERHDGQAVTIEDFPRRLRRRDRHRPQPVQRWYGQAGTPEVTAKGEYDVRRKTYTSPSASRRRRTPGQNLKLPLHIPMRFGLIGPNGADIDYDLATRRADRA